MAAYNPELPSSFVASNDHILNQDCFVPTGDFYILVRNHLFIVISFFLARDSRFWQPIVERLYSSSDAPGSSQDRPFFLDEDPTEVAKFLSVPITPRYNIYDHTPAQWGAIFRLADQWDAPVIRDLALSNIQSAQMDMAEKLRVLLRYKAPREVYSPLMETLVSHDELPEDLLSVYVGGSRIDEANDVPDGAAAPQAPQSSHEEGSVFLIPPASTLFTTSTGSTNSNSMSENGNSPSVPVSSVPDISITCGEKKEVVDQLPDGSYENVKGEKIADLSDQWVMVEENQSDDHSQSHPSVRQPLTLHDFIIPYCLFILILSAFLA